MVLRNKFLWKKSITWTLHKREVHIKKKGFMNFRIKESILKLRELIHFRIRSSFSSWVSNITYFVFNILYLRIIHIFLNDIIFTTSLSLLKSARAGADLLTSNLSTLLFKLLKLVVTLFSLSKSNLSSLDFKLAKSTYLANFDISIPAAVFKSTFVT